MSWWKWGLGVFGAALVLGGRRALMNVTPEEFVETLRETLAAVAPHLGASAQQIVVAHAALESGWGKSTPAQKGYNLFNVTRPQGDPRPVIESGDLECDGAGVCRPITQRFAAYGSVGEALADYFRLLSGTRYAGALGALEIGDSAGFVQRLREGGYFTLSLGEYQNRFAGVLASVRKRWVS